jgi:hypothetical protein
MARRFFLVVCAAFGILVTPLVAAADTLPIAQIAANLDQAIQQVNASDAAGALKSVNAADRLYDPISDALDQIDAATEKQINDAMDSTKDVLAATPPDLAAAAAHLQTARSLLNKFLTASPAAATTLPRTGGLPLPAGLGLGGLGLGLLVGGRALRQRER